MRGLEKINWLTLRHAHGAAGDVPEMLRGLVDPDPARREQALEAFWEGPLHQGSHYTATVAAIPFVIQALDVPHADHPALLHLLTTAAQVGPDARGCRRFDLDALLRSDPFPRFLGRRQWGTDRVWVARECWAAAGAGCATYRRFLSREHAVETRALAARLLALFPTQGRQAIAELRRIAMNEREPEPLRASAFIALGHFVRIEVVESDGLLISAATRIGAALAEQDPEERRALLWPLVDEEAALKTPRPWPWPELAELVRAQLPPEAVPPRPAVPSAYPPPRRELPAAQVARLVDVVLNDPDDGAAEDAARKLSGVDLGPHLERVLAQLGVGERGMELIPPLVAWTAGAFERVKQFVRELDEEHQQVAMNVFPRVHVVGMPAMLAALKDRHPLVRRCACRQLQLCLGEHPEAQQAIEPLASLLDDPDALVRDTAARALAEQGGLVLSAWGRLESRLPTGAKAELLRVIGAEGDETAFGAVAAAAAAATEPELRLAAVEAIAERPPSSALLELVAPLCRDDDHRVRDRAVQVVGLFGARARAAVPALIQAGESRDQLLALGRVATYDQIGEWLKLQEHEEVAWTLWAMRPASAGALREWLEEEPGHRLSWMLTEL